MILKWKSKIVNFLFVMFLMFQTTACYSSKKAVNIISENIESLRNGNKNSLAKLTIDSLRIANDDENGTLYYGGLWLHFNGHRKKAEIALRRAARTGAEPWAKESARLVVYFMTREARYNQIKPFLDSLFTVKQIREDTELFYYQALALFLTREYEALTALLDLQDTKESLSAPTHPQWHHTLKRRIQVEQSVFSYYFWSALMKLQENPQNSTLLYNTLVSYPTKDMLANTPIFLQKIYDSTQLSPAIQKILEAKIMLQSQGATKDTMEAFLALDPSVFAYAGMIEDLLILAKKNKRYVNRIVRIFQSIKKNNITDTQIAYVNTAQADLYFQKERYKDSYKFYERAFSNKDAYKMVHEDKKLRALWRMLYSLIQINPSLFIGTFNEVVSYTENPRYFSNILEEYLSILLRNKRYAQLQEDLQTLSLAHSDRYINTELNRWRFILNRSGNLHNNVSNNFFHRETVYVSDAPFEYLFYTEALNKKKFLGAWTMPEESVNSFQIVAEMQRVFISEKLVNGYFLYGLDKYATDIISKNITTVSASLARKSMQYLLDSGNYVNSLFIARSFAAHSVIFPQTEDDFRLLYPHGFFSNIINKLTQDDKEKAVLYALMREESSFDKDVMSFAGAIGLMQILPSTAQDIAKRISYGSFNLRNAQDNITLGYNYYTYLLKVIPKPALVFAAYNGGLGNLWKWEKRFDTSDVLVFADSLPFKETRNYVRKVMSSALIYAMLYYDIAPEELKDYFIGK